ncbi:copper fist DNA binding domain-containing protein [Russula vinacea]|nr:copper fist DNA binding domain-containing protein [Russula vinacea]
MVFVNSRKFACESCIKGHRSSSCTHTERPLYEIKKKGRPVSQCERCRQLRNTKKVHSKCTCSETSPSQTREVTDRVFGTKQKRYIPIVPALPNGLKDAFATSNTPIAPAHPRQKVAALLNPCQCNDVWNCGCRTSAPDADSEFAAQAPVLSPNSNKRASAQAPSDGLETLARAAAAVLISSPLTPRHAANQITSSPGANEHASPSRSHHPSEIGISPTSSPTPIPGPAPVVPPFSTFTTLAGSGCTCGLTCQCPGCPTHHSRPGRLGFYMESPVLERFFADAERVPPPPTAGGKPVELPKLCCGGSCGCGGACDNERNGTHNDDLTSVTVGPLTE